MNKIVFSLLFERGLMILELYSQDTHVLLRVRRVGLKLPSDSFK